MLWGPPTMNKLTSQQEKFAQQVAAGLSQSDAYRFSYPASKKRADATVWVDASKLAANPKVSLRIKELKTKAAAQCLITIDVLVRQLESARIIALAQEKPQCGVAVAAIMAQAKLLGLDKEAVEITGTGMPLINVTFVKPDSKDGN